MKNVLYAFLLASSCSHFSYASTPGQWECMAFDKREQSFEAAGDSIEHAMEAAIGVCKQRSPHAQTCRTAQSFCEQGPLTLEGDRCLVTDDDGHSWETTGKEACKTALALCNRFLNLEGGPRGQCSVKHGGDSE